jgi:asparagine synthase (glutamine-hydrolysing)
MVDRSSGCALVFNGEIYNFREIRKTLETLGHVFYSSGDTEVLLRGYLQWGESIVNQLRGMFAFALWDAPQQRLFLARDPYGIKPLYYLDQAGSFAFSSQVRPLRQYIAKNDRPDPAGVVGFLLLGSVPEPYTMYSSIRALPAGHTLRISASGVVDPTPYASVAQVWADASRQPEYLDKQTFLQRVRTEVSHSVNLHQIADVPVGAFLSSGIDSGALVGLMAETQRACLNTLTLGFRDFQGTLQDEVSYAEHIASLYKTQHHTAWVSEAEAKEDLPKVLEDMDQPSVDGINTWLVSKYAAAQGLKVVVSGIGGDELFGGYSTFHQLPVLHTYWQRAKQLPGFLSLLALGARVGHQFGWVHAKAEGLVQMGDTLAGLYLVRRGLFLPHELSQLLDQAFLSAGLAALAPPYFLHQGIGSLITNNYATVAALEASFYLRNQLLRDSDWASMAHSLELRTPLVDFQLLQALAPLLVSRSPSVKGKLPLALAPHPSLPEMVINRPKSGFSLPIDSWITTSDILTEWRNHSYLAQPKTPWARRMAYTLVTRQFPDLLTT